MKPKAASTCETCETWPELVLKLVCSSKFHEFHELHANTNEFQDELWPSFTGCACLREGRRLQTLAGCTCVGAEVQGKSLQSLRAQTKRRCGATGADQKNDGQSTRDVLGEQAQV